jgi:hypothetical protein
MIFDGPLREMSDLQTGRSHRLWITVTSNFESAHSVREGIKIVSHATAGTYCYIKCQGPAEIGLFGKTITNGNVQSSWQHTLVFLISLVPVKVNGVTSPFILLEQLSKHELTEEETETISPISKPMKNSTS